MTRLILPTPSAKVSGAALCALLLSGAPALAGNPRRSDRSLRPSKARSTLRQATGGKSFCHQGFPA
jgi:hypothetical protein